jgi:exodeoxyribonuclease V gamma subunit
VELTDLLLEKEERLQTEVTTSSEQFREFKTDTLLGTLKGDILEGQNRGAAVDDTADELPAIMVRPGDRSFGLHACHSPMREVEILYDQLLGCFETMPGLRPRDILVMTPAIEEYAPFIRAVFEYPEDESKRIPYSLAGRHPRSESPTIDTFLTLLDLPGSRYTASQIFGLFGSRSLRRRFHFTDDDLSQIRDWIQQTNIRWGIDGEHRKRLGLPDLNTNTWRHGLQRLLLGHAMEGKNRTLLGRFVTAAEALFQLTESLEHPRPLVDWAKPLTEMLDQFFDPAGEEEVRDVRFLRLIVGQLRTILENGSSDGDVVFPVVRYYLEGQLARLEQRGNFFSTGVTFCALTPVRGIPARVVCLLGINDQIFPSRPQPTQFDLMAQQPRAGDPSARQDDRYSFLQAVLAAEERLLISYVGRSAIHNQEIPPSVVVSELLDYANQAFVFPGKKSAREFLLTEHPLQAFSPRYFAEPRDDERLFGYSEANATASRTIHSAQSIEIQPFLGGPLPPAGEPSSNLELRELINFWRHPSEYFVRNRLGLDLKDRGFSLEDAEPFQPTPLALYPLRQELLTQELDGETLPVELFEARGVLSSGVIGQLQLGSIRTDIQNLAENVRRKIGHRKRDPAALIDLALPAYTLTGKIENLYGGQNVHFRPAKLQPKDYLRAWIEHLAFCVGGKGEKTILIGRDGAVTFSPVSSAQEELENLCDLYLLGLSQPIRFFPGTSMAFAEAKVSGERDSFRMAREKWDPYRRRGEKDDPYFERCFHGLDPFEDPFAEISLKVFKTMFEQMERNEP